MTDCSLMVFLTILTDWMNGDEMGWGKWQDTVAEGYLFFFLPRQERGRGRVMFELFSCISVGIAQHELSSKT